MDSSQQLCEVDDNLLILQINRDSEESQGEESQGKESVIVPGDSQGNYVN